MHVIRGERSSARAWSSSVKSVVLAVAGRAALRPPFAALIFVVAFLARLLPVIRGGGLTYYGRYDDGVYYAASDALTFGHVPYRDFVLLHPPGSTLALMPFTVLGRLISDPVGMSAARLAIMAVGGVNSVLVASIAAKWGKFEGLLAGLVYACSAAAIYSEQATFLEPLGSLLILVAALLLLSPESGAWRSRAAGVALGLACAVKIWYAAPFAAVLVVLLVLRRLRTAIRVAVAGAVAAAIVLAPFFVLAPRQMWTMVISDQFGRDTSPTSRVARFASIFGTKTVLTGHTTSVDVVTVVLVVVTLVMLIICMVDRRAWIVVALFVANLATLFASPSYFRHYGVFLIGPLALIFSIGLGRLLRPLPSLGLAVGGAALVAAVVGSGVVTAWQPTGDRFPGARFSAAAPSGCITSDDPAGLIQMNRLSSDLRQGCDVPVDVTGASYGPLPRRQNAAFQRWLTEHLLSGRAFVILRPRRDILAPAQKHALHAQPVLAAAEGLVLRSGLGR